MNIKRHHTLASPLHRSPGLGRTRPLTTKQVSLLCLTTLALQAGPAGAALVDQTQTPNIAAEGIARSLQQQVGAGHGDAHTPGSAVYLIKRDPARAIRRGRQLFQRKFTLEQGLGPRVNHQSVGDIHSNPNFGAGLVDSCSGCHGRPRGSAGFGGEVATRPDSRDAPHLFGLGLQEMLADEITRDLRALRDAALARAAATGAPSSSRLVSKGIDFGTITAHPDQSVDTTGVEGVGRDLRVRPFSAQGRTVSIREFVVGALNAEMGLQSPDPCLVRASHGGICVTPAGMVLDGSMDRVESPPVLSTTEDPDGDGVANEIDPALVDFIEFYLLNYFRPALGEQSARTDAGFTAMDRIGCTECHVRSLPINHDRRVADVETVHDPVNGIFNRLFATASVQVRAQRDDDELPLYLPKGEPFLVENIFTDFKRHNLGPDFYERNYDGTVQRRFLTEPLWGVGSTAPYGHDGRSISLKEVILRHGGEATGSRNQFGSLTDDEQRMIVEALDSLVLFPPDDTASNLSPGDPTDPDFPQSGHGSIKLGVLFQTPGPE